VELHRTHEGFTAGATNYQHMPRIVRRPCLGKSYPA
jgi:hypothetical protein